MKKILIGLMFLLASTVAFADTLVVTKKNSLSDTTYAKVYTNMRMSHRLTASSMNDNEYILTEYGLYYKVDGKLCLTTMFELEFD